MLSEKMLSRFRIFTDMIADTIGNGFNLLLGNGQVGWDDEIILDKLTKKVVNIIGEQNRILILNPIIFPKEFKEVLILPTDCAALTDFNKKLICQICIIC
jgi:hypothetical protein